MSKASNLISLLEMAATASDKKKAEDSMKKLAAKFFPNMPLPTVKVRDNLASSWAGQHIWFKDTTKNIIEIQKYVIDAGGEYLDKVMAHELIHQRQALDGDNRDFNRAYANLNKKLDTAHGETFKKWAEEINSVMGDGFVTPKSDLVAVKSTKKFCILIIPSKSYKNKYSCYTFQKVNDSIIDFLNRYPDMKLFVTDDNELARKRGKYFYVPLDNTVQEKLKKLYEEGKDVRGQYV